MMVSKKLESVLNDLFGSYAVDFENGIGLLRADQLRKHINTLLERRGALDLKPMIYFGFCSEHVLDKGGVSPIFDIPCVYYLKLPARINEIHEFLKGVERDAKTKK